MGRHRTQEEKRELGERARQMRAAGRSRREIQAELGIGDDLAKAFLRGVPLPDALSRPRAKDDDRAAARELRAAGWTYDQIAVELEVSKSTCSLWLRDVVVEEAGGPVDAPAVITDPRVAEARERRAQGLTLQDIGGRMQVSPKTVYYWTWDLPVPRTARPGGDKAHMDMMRKRYWDRVLAEREDERERMKAQHAQRLGALTTREIEIAAVVAYWCEGSKSKPYARREQVTFINSDPGLILLFLAWLSIHESADVAAATAWWADVTAVEAGSFGRPMLKRHNPKTVRKNVGDDYVGCLVIRLRQCRSLYQQIEGVWQGIMGALPESSVDDPSRVV